MSVDEFVNLCFEHKLKIEQLFLLYLLARKDVDRQSLVVKYTREIDKFPMNVIDGLEQHGYIEDFNSPGRSFPEMYMLTNKAKLIFATPDMGEELWDAYPAAFPMKDKGKSFVARAGGDKNHIVSEYLVRIGRSTKRHEFVMQQLSKYKDLVERDLINGYKISDFVKMELWDTIAELETTNSDGFGRDL